MSLAFYLFEYIPLYFSSREIRFFEKETFSIVQKIWKKYTETENLENNETVFLADFFLVLLLFN